MDLKVGRVSFCVELCKAMTRDEFARKHNCYFEELTDKERQKILVDTYDKINPPMVKREKKANDDKLEVG